MRDYNFAKKLLYFLAELASVPPAQMIAKIDQSQKYRVKVGEKLLYLLDACEDHAAASIIARLFVGFVRGKLTYDEFLRASRACRIVGTEDLMLFVKNGGGQWGLEESGELVAAGLLVLLDPEIEIAHTSHRGSMVKGMKPMQAVSSHLGDKIREVLSG